MDAGAARDHSNSPVSEMRGAIMEHAADIESKIEHYRGLLVLFMTSQTRQAVERLLDQAETDLAKLRRARQYGPSEGSD